MCFVGCRPDVLDAIMQLQHFENQFLPNALRKFFKETAPLSVRNDILSDLITKFSERFCACNPHLQLSHGKIPMRYLMWACCSVWTLMWRQECYCTDPCGGSLVSHSSWGDYSLSVVLLCSCFRIILIPHLLFWTRVHLYCATAIH